MKSSCIALLTDFGADGFFVASLKGVILSINPRAALVDIDHAIPSFDLRTAAFELFAAARFFPRGTIFLAIVDPGVGSDRRILLIQTLRHYFIGPDNGVLSLALSREKILGIHSLTNPRYFLPEPSLTFEGRDKMAPAAAWLSKGAKPALFGPRLRDYVRLPIPSAFASAQQIIGQVMYVDKFGNLITNIPADMMRGLAARKGVESLMALAGRKKIGGLRTTFSSATKGESFFLVGSLGLVEVAVRGDSARARLNLKPGDEIRIKTDGKS
jgi:S-adenosylmethionine hydrolase